MYFLDFLRQSTGNGNAQGNDLILVEYRLVCSGELYNCEVMTGDHRKSSPSRILLQAPLDLTVASVPFDNYPQELCLRFRTSPVTERKGIYGSTFLPDEEIAQAFSALLSLFCRRFITVAARVRQIHESDNEGCPPAYRDIPSPFINAIKISSWSRRPGSLIYGPDGIEDYNDYNPPPLGISPVRLKQLLEGIAEYEYSEALLRSARLYASALETIETKPENSYQLLISCIEVLANTVLKEYKPAPDEIVEAKRPVYNLAMKLGLSQENAKTLAIAASSGDPWVSRKFKKFLVDNVTEELWTKDDVFIELSHLLPKPENLEGTLTRIYNMRSEATHQGQEYPKSAGVGTSPLIPFGVMPEMGDPKGPFPPVVWFERVVNIAIRNFVVKKLGLVSDITGVTSGTK